MSVVNPGSRIDPKLARALIRSLTRGTSIPQGATLIHVGHEKWLAAQAELLDEIREDGYSDTKFVRGAYGAGKSHFLSVVQEMARKSNWVTSHIECHFDRIEIDRFETLYPAMIRKLRLPGSDASLGDGAAIRTLLAKWVELQLASIGITAESTRKPFDADSRLFGALSRRLFDGSVPASNARALMAAAMAALHGDASFASSICSWLGGEVEALSIPASYLKMQHRNLGDTRQEEKPVVLKPINAGTVRDAMAGMLWLVKDAGYSGLVFCIDEVEELARLKTRKRQDRALQALREFVDHAGGDGSHRWLCMYLAATPEMFDSDEYFPRYDALASRIQSVSDRVNWRAPVIDFDKTPLSPADLRRLAEHIRELFVSAYGAEAVAAVDNSFLSDVVGAITRSRVRTARPRLLTRIVVDELERARGAGEDYVKPVQFDDLIAKAATHVEVEVAS
ncbi:MAG: DUF2791 family P-loop domain-containing protein [Burkholderiales bacterium]|nr:DUF2791 family P-loop domain-containing protein [Burkholderiales bacterium]